MSSIFHSPSEELVQFYQGYVGAQDKGLYLKEFTANEPAAQAFERLYGDWSHEDRSRLSANEQLGALRALRILASLGSEKALPEIDAELDKVVGSRGKFRQLSNVEKEQAEKFGFYCLLHQTKPEHIPGILAGGSLMPRVASSGVGGSGRHDNTQVFFTALVNKRSKRYSKLGFELTVMPSLVEKVTLVFSTALVPLSDHISSGQLYGQKDKELSFTWGDIPNMDEPVDKRLLRNTENEVVFSSEVPIFPFLQEIWVRHEGSRKGLIEKLQSLSLKIPNYDWQKIVVFRDDFPEEIRYNK